MTTDNGSENRRQPGAGERLRKAREAAGLTVNEVADHQHLRPAVIKAIENGDYRQIDSELFLKGYVRAYASHVGVDPESIIRQLDRELEPLREEQKAKVESNPLITIERRKRRKRQIARIVGVLVVVAVAFYAGSLYLASQQSADDGAAAEVDETTGNAVEPDAVEAPAADVGTDVEAGQGPDGGNDLLDEAPTEPESPEASPELDAQGQPAEDTASALEPEAAMVAGNTVGSGGTAELAEPGVDTTQVNASADSEVQPVNDTAIRSEPLDEPETVSVAEEGQLQVEFSDDCWVEVQDSTGRTLEASLRSAGDTLELTGEPPLRVVLGAVSAVESLRYSGDTVDLTDRRVRNNRLVLNLP